MLILGIETAGPTASAALLRDGELLSEIPIIKMGRLFLMLEINRRQLTII